MLRDPATDHGDYLMKDVVPQSMVDLIRRVRGEYLEMPGLKLTSTQASRLWGLERHTCQRLLDTLAEARFLIRGSDGSYSLLHDATERSLPVSIRRSTG
jgi:hypothetical protein